MRIAFATTEYITEKISFDGGLSNYINRIAMALRDGGHDVIVFVYSNENRVFNHNGIEVHRVDIRLPHERVRFPWKLLAKLYRSICKRRFPLWYKNIFEQNIRLLNQAIDKVHRSHPVDIVQYCSCQGTSLFRPTSIPAAMRISSYAPLLYHNYGINPNCCRQEIEIEQICIQNCRHIFAPSELLASVLHQEFSKEITVIESPFFIEEVKKDFTLLEQYGLRDKKYLLFFGTIGLLKGCLTISQILNRFFTDYPDRYFVLIGKSTQYQEKSFDAILRASIIPEYADRLLILDKMPHASLYPFIEHCEGVVLPSRIDNLPNTALEAMGHKKIVVGTRGASFEQLINDGDSGFLCAIDDAEGLYSCLQRLVALPPATKKDMEARAYQRTLALRPSHIVEQLLAFYTKVIAEHRQQHRRAVRRN